MSITISVEFTLQMKELNITYHGSGSGTVTKDPDMNLYPVGTKVKITAIPATGSIFEKWTFPDGSISRTNPFIYTIT